MDLTDSTTLGYPTAVVYPGFLRGRDILELPSLKKGPHFPMKHADKNIKKTGDKQGKKGKQPN